MGWIRAYVDFSHPLCSPNYPSETAKLTATPTDTWPTQFFCFWSLLCDISEKFLKCLVHFGPDATLCSWPWHMVAPHKHALCWGSGKHCIHSWLLPLNSPSGAPSGPSLPQPHVKPSSFTVSLRRLLWLLKQQALFIALLPSVSWIRRLSYLFLETKVDSEVS